MERKLRMNRVPRTGVGMLLVILCSLPLVGCGEDSSPSPRDSLDGRNQSGVSLPKGMFLESAPGDARSIIELKKTAKEGDEVLMHVVIGGRARPFVENRAIMTVVEMTMPNQCTFPGEHCTTPWDFCCASPEELRENSATVQINDAQGRLLKVDLPAASPLKPMSILLVRGTVGPRPDEQTLVVNASGIYVETAR